MDLSCPPRRLPLLVVLVAAGVAASAQSQRVFRLERAGESTGAIELTWLEGGVVKWLERRTDGAREGVAVYDENGAVVKGRFVEGQGEGASEVVVEVADGKVSLRVGDESRPIDVPLTFRARLKPGKVFTILHKLTPAVLLGGIPVAARSDRRDVEVGAVIVDPTDGLRQTPLFKPIRLVRTRKPRRVELVDGRVLDAYTIDVFLEGAHLMSVICDHDGVIYASRIETRSTPRYGETALSDQLR